MGVKQLARTIRQSSSQQKAQQKYLVHPFKGLYLKRKKKRPSPPCSLPQHRWEDKLVGAQYFRRRGL